MGGRCPTHSAALPFAIAAKALHTMTVRTHFSKLVLGLLAVRFMAVECKVQSGTLTFGGPTGNQDSQWKFLGKFGYAIGTGRYEIRLRLHNSLDQDQVLPRPHLEIFLDEDWPQHGRIAACRRAEEGNPANAAQMNIFVLLPACCFFIHAVCAL
eukprot:g29906.t1